MAFYEQTNFAKGILGKALQDRTDLEIYQQAVFDCVDYIVTGQGTLKAQGIDYNVLNTDPSLIAHLKSSFSSVVMYNNTTDRYTIFCALNDNASNPNRVVALSYKGVPVEANRLEITEIGIKSVQLSFALGNELYYRDGIGNIAKIEWLFNLGSEKYRTVDIFSFPPVHLESTRLTKIPNIGNYLSTDNLKYRYDPRAKYIEIAFTSKSTSTLNITKIKININWDKCSGTWSTFKIYDYSDTEILKVDRFDVQVDGRSKTFVINDAKSIKKVAVGSACIAGVTMEYFDSITGRWYGFFNEEVGHYYGGNDFIKDNIGVSAPSATKPDVSDLIPFFREHMYEIDVCGNRARFDSVVSYGSADIVENDPFPNLVKIVAKYELITAGGVDTLEYDYANSKEQVVWITTEARFIFARKEFKEVYQASMFFFYQNRLVIAGIPNYEDTLIMSAVNDFKDYSIRNMNSDPIITRFTSPRGIVKIKGFGELASMIVYTDRGIWCTPPKTTFMASNSNFEFINSLDTEPSIQQSMAESIVISGKNRDRIYQINYDGNARKYTVKDLNIINNNILKDIRSIQPLNLNGQSEYAFLSIFSDKEAVVVNLDDNESVLGYTRMSVTPRGGFRGTLRILDKDYVWFNDVLATIEPTVAKESSITFLVPFVKTTKMSMKYDDNSKIKSFIVKVIGDYSMNVEFDNDIIEPALDTDATDFETITPVIDYENSRPLYFKALDNIPVNRKLKVFNTGINNNEHEITSVLFEVI
ncbi:MAG: hypothetical protein ACRCYT_07780 [Cetobacterium sp.]